MFIQKDKIQNEIIPQKTIEKNIFDKNYNKIQNKATEHGRWITSIYLIIVFVAFLLLSYMNSMEKATVNATRRTNETRTISSFQHMEMSDAHAPTGIRDIYTWTIEDLQHGDNCLAFYLVHSYVEVYLGDNLVYSLMPHEENRIGKTLGSNWVSVPLYAYDQGRDIRIEIIPAYKSFQNRSLEFLIGEKHTIYLEQFKKDLPQIMISMLLIITGIVFFIIMGYNYIKNKDSTNLISISVLSFLLGLWRITDLRSAPLLFPQNTLFLSYLTLTSLLLIVIPIVRSINVSLQFKYKQVWNLVSSLSCLVTGSILMLQITNISDLRETLLASHLMIVIAAIICILVVSYEWYKDIERKRNAYKYILFLFCLIGAGLDISCYYIYGSSSSIILTMIGFLSYIIVFGVLLIKEFYWQKGVLIQQEEELESSRIMIMLSQIQPHFMFNCLNSISYLCKEDADMAERAITDFSDYLRGNLDSLNRKEAVQFDVELSHVKIYLSLEKMRFQDRLNIVYDIGEFDFKLPALTVQPIVENAVKHGVGKKREGGTITISTRSEENFYVIEIADDGVGFEPGVMKEDGRSHIGIENVRSRLWTMSQGTLDFESAIGQGSRAVIHIPR